MMLCAHGVGKRAEGAERRDVRRETIPIARDGALFFRRACSIPNIAEHGLLGSEQGAERIRMGGARGGSSACVEGITSASARSAILVRLVRDLGRPVPVEALVKEVGERPQITAALRVLIDQGKLNNAPFEIAKAGEGTASSTRFEERVDADHPSSSTGPGSSPRFFLVLFV